MVVTDQKIDDDVVVSLDDEEIESKEKDKVKEPQIKVEQGVDDVSGPSVDEGIEELKAKLLERERAEAEARDRAAKEKARADDLEQRQRAGEDEIAHYKAQLFVKELDSADQIIDSMAREIAAAKLAGAAASEAGDESARWDAQERLSRAAARLTEAETYKARLELRKDEIAADLKQRQAAIEEAKKNPPKREMTADERFEQYASSVSQASARWLRDHKQDALDPVSWNIIVAADGEARRLGKAADSDAYFKHIESRLKAWKGEADADEGDDDAAQEVARPASVAAPVSRSAPNNRRGQGNTVKLRKDEREIAWALRPDLSKAQAEVVYAKNKLAIEREREDSVH